MDPKVKAIKRYSTIQTLSNTGPFIVRLVVISADGQSYPCCGELKNPDLVDVTHVLTDVKLR